MDEMTRSLDRRERRPGRDDEASAFPLALPFDSGMRGFGLEELAANQADRVV
jgi:hypothetical protein